MTTTMSRRLLLMALTVGASIGAPIPSGAQPARRPPRQERFAPAEVQRLFDAYTLLQAQEALRLNDAQYEQFVPRMKALQEVRRRNQQARGEILRALARAAGQEQPNQALLRERLRALDEHDQKGAAALRSAYQDIDEVLDLRQRARFRVFEETIEQRKFELLVRARRGRAMQVPEP